MNALKSQMTCHLKEETCVNKRKVLLTIWSNNGVSGAMLKTLVRKSTLPLSHTQLGPLSAPHTASLSLSTDWVERIPTSQCSIASTTQMEDVARMDCI